MQLGTGSAAEEKNVKWHLYKYLSFLNHIKYKRPLTNKMPEEMFDSSQSLCIDLPNTSSPCYLSDSDVDNQINRVPSFKRPRMRYEALERRPEERLIKKALADEDDHVDHFMKSIAKSVKTLPPELISEAKLGILTLVTNFSCLVYLFVFSKLNFKILVHYLYLTSKLQPPSLMLKLTLVPSSYLVYSGVLLRGKSQNRNVQN